MRIYVAGPYTALDADSIVANVRAAIDAGITLLERGHAPFIPHLTYFVDQRAAEIDVNISYEDYLAWDMTWLSVSDALLFLGSSKGADRELALAQSLNLPVYQSVDEVPQT